MKKSEKSTSKTKSERDRRFGLEHQRGVIQSKLFQGIAQFPAEPSLHGLLGHIYHDLGDEPRSREAYQRALMLDARQAGGRPR
jgi:Tfp pilus assembly protein PilF